MNTTLGDRMKHQYEDRTRVLLPRRTYTIIRVDGKAFHTFTKRYDGPYDEMIVTGMNEAMLALCSEAQGTAFGYTQSDEISILLTDFATNTTDAWFDNNLQKIVSVSASIVTAAFNASLGTTTALFDCRVFTIPDAIEVENYFVWRQQDAVRNSIQSLAQAHFSHKELHGLNVNALQEKLFQEKKINWNDLPIEQKRGRTAIKDDFIYVNILRGDKESEAYMNWSLDSKPPIFTAERMYLRSRIPQREIISEKSDV
jgi:tRNA(His) guanylyltransferase